MKNSVLSLSILVAPLLALGACRAPSAAGWTWSDGDPAAGTSDAWLRDSRFSSQPTSAQLASGQAGVEAADEARDSSLYGWNGGVVQGREEGEMGSLNTGSRSLSSEKPDRMHIIELYQEVLDERDLLADEVELLTKALQDSDNMLTSSESGALGLTSRVTELESEVQRLRAENEELAGRLVTAQIRRLESEKMLLEARIAAAKKSPAAGDLAMGNRP